MKAKRFAVAIFCFVALVGLQAGAARADHTPSCPAGSCHPGGAWERAHPGATCATRRFSTPAAANKTPPAPGAGSRPEHGNCTRTQHRKLQQDVIAACKRDRACKGGQSCETLIS